MTCVMFQAIKYLALIVVLLTHTIQIACAQHEELIHETVYKPQKSWAERQAQEAERKARKDRCAVLVDNDKLAKNQRCLDCNDQVCIVYQSSEDSQPDSSYEKNKYGLFDHGGKVISPLKYDHLSFSQEASGTLLVAEEHGDWGFINVHGEVVIDIKYRWESDFSDGVACMHDDSPLGMDKSCAYFNAKGNIIVPPGKWEESSDFNEGLAAVRDTAGKCGYIDTTGDVVIPFKYASPSENRMCGDSYSRRIMIGNEGKVGFIDLHGNIVVTPRYQDARPFQHGSVTLVKEPSGWGFIDLNGVPVSEFKYADYSAYSITDGLVRLKLASCDDSSENADPCREGIVQLETGRHVVPIEFESVEILEWKNQKFIVATIPDDVEHHCFYDHLGTLLMPCEYKYRDVEDYLIHAERVEEKSSLPNTAQQNEGLEGFEGVFDFHGRVIVPFKYHDIEFEGQEILSENELQTITYDLSGKVLKTQHLPQGHYAYRVLNDDNSEPELLATYTVDEHGNRFTRSTLAAGEKLYMILIANKSAHGKKADIDLGLTPDTVCQYRFLDESLVVEEGVLKGVTLNGDSYDPDNSERVLNNKTRITIIGTGLKKCS